MALATKEWSKIKHTSEDLELLRCPFRLLTTNLTYLFQGQQFPVSGFLLPGDLVGTQSERFYNAGHPNGYGGADHASTVRETVAAIGDVRRVMNRNEPLVDLDVRSSERRPHMQVQMNHSCYTERGVGTISEMTAAVMMLGQYAAAVVGYVVATFWSPCRQTPFAW
ncbi:hypothetical protein F4823DRAFT_580460 [Ustulina deusta]|nr:hypothetical protein F4823DRAFT_580460 [Ustulina deusta]